VLIPTEDNLIKPFILVGGDIVENILKITMTSLKGDVEVNFLWIKNVKITFMKECKQTSHEKYWY
jgi:hypothetical protein